MRTLKTFVLSALLAVIAAFPALAQSQTQNSAPTQEQAAAHSQYQLARSILGDDFITPEEVAKARGLTYTDTQITRFRDTLPSREALEWLRDNDFMLLAGPPTELSLLDVRRQDDTLFYSKNGKGWYAGERETFSRNDTVGPVWLTLRKSPVPYSTVKTWNEQQALLSENERVPNATELAWGLTTYKAVRNVYLMSNVVARTSSVDADGYRVYVGFFDQSGLYVYFWWDDYRGGDLGVSSARLLAPR